MAARLVDVADTLTVFDPVAERQQSLADQGAVSAQSPLEAAREADALFVMVVNEAQCEEALFGSDGAVAALPQDAVVVIMSTVGPHAVRALAERLHRRGVQLVDAPVSGGVAPPRRRRPADHGERTGWRARRRPAGTDRDGFHRRRLQSLGR